MTYLQTQGTDWQAPFVNSASPTSYQPQGDAVTWLDSNAPGNTVNAGATLALTSGPGGNAISSSSADAFPTNIITVTDTAVYSNYTAVISGQSGTLSSPGYLAISDLSQNGYGSVLQGYWVRTRTCPKWHYANSRFRHLHFNAIYRFLRYCPCGIADFEFGKSRILLCR